MKLLIDIKSWMSVMFRHINITFAALLFSSSFAYANNDLSPKLMSELFESCRQSCIQYPQALPDHKKYANTSFLFESYCGCYCTRQTLSLSIDDIIMIGRLQTEGKSLNSNKRLSDLMRSNADVCIRAVGVKNE